MWKVKLEKGVHFILACHNTNYRMGSNGRGCLKSQNTREPSHPEFISGSDIQCIGILKQVQDDGINDF